MTRTICTLVAALAVVALTTLGCSSAPPAASPTTSAPPKATAQAAAPEPTKVAVVQPTAVPTKAALDYPVKGKSISLIVGAAAGGPTDTGARLVAAPFEKLLGTPVQVINKPGANWQVALTEVNAAKPDGYTLGFAVFPATIALYLDPARKTTFNRTSLQPVAMQVVDVGVPAVKADSPYKDLKELVDAAKAKPDTIKVGTTGIGTDDHLAVLQLEKLTGAKFTLVHFESTPPAMTAILGGHIDVLFDNVGSFVSQVKSGDLRVLAVLGKEESKYYPGVKTAQAQGIPLVSSSSRGIVMPAGAPKELLGFLADSMKKAMADEQHLKKMDELGLKVEYMNPDEFRTFWDEFEAQVSPLMSMMK